MALWSGLGQAATVAQLVGADVGGLISMIMQAAVTAQQNKKECEQLARRVFTIAELLQHLQDPEVLRRPEIRRPLAGLDDTLREAHELVMACQEKSAVYRLVMAGRQADRFRDVQSRIDSYLLLFPVISHIDITRRLDRIYRILLPNDTTMPSPSSGSHSHELELQAKVMLHEEEGEKFTFVELAAATNYFAPDRQIGEGGFGTMYIGYLLDGREVAIKRMHKDVMYRMTEEFLAEVSILPSLRHKHIIRLYGCCGLDKEKRHLLPPFRKKKEEEPLLVYEYMKNGSLSDHLHGPSSLSSSPVTMSWKTRIEILLGVSRAIEYVQSYAERPMIHGDIKPSNILLDASWAPRLSDFGFALPWEGPDHDEAVIGTFGYMAPEYVMRGTLNLTTDIYSLGVVMLVVLTGKQPYNCFGEEPEEKREEQDGEKREECEEEYNTEEWDDSFGSYLYGKGFLVSSALPRIEAGELWKVLDRRPAPEPTARQLEAVELVAQAATRCLRMQAEDRPAISEVVAYLKTALELARCDA